VVSGEGATTGFADVRSALFFSDVHLGWSLCSQHHAQWIERLPEAVEDADLVVLNGDIVDRYRRVQRPVERALVTRLAELVANWRSEGRHVVYIEGNHDAGSSAGDPIAPDRWMLDFETAHGERVRVLHGHRFSGSESRWALYDRIGSVLLPVENFAYGRVEMLQALYRFGPGWPVAAIGSLECFLARRALPARLAPLIEAVDVLVHGHIHYGPGRGRIGDVTTWRTGAWVSPGHLGTFDRMLRYRRGRFERIGWADGAWRAFDDGR
jgi:UDP-2,3-diacylglucosamine pyrophosphatase LpxH